MKDFTQDEADRWLQKELGKCTTPELKAERLSQEKLMQPIVNNPRNPYDFPNAKRARVRLMEILEGR